MDLIERDEVMHEIGKLSLAWEYWQAVKDCYEIVKKAPTVEAIPVEWINKYANEHRAYIHAFAEMVVCWNERKEE